MKTKAQSEVWTGAVEQLPKRRRDLSPDLFATIEPSVHHSGIGIITVYGLLDAPRWLKLAAAVGDLARAADRLLIRVSSRSQTARSAGVAFASLEQVSAIVPTTVVIESAGVGGAALAFAQFAREVVAEDEGTSAGWLDAKALYGRGNPAARPAAIERIIRRLAFRRKTGLENTRYADIVGRMVNAGELTLTDATAAIGYLNDLGGTRR